jgi:predicted nucleic acid-binding protein
VILIDTSCWIEFFHPKGSPGVKKVVTLEIEQNRVAICGAVICEITRGLAEREAAVLSRLFEGLHYFPQEDQDWRTVQQVSSALKCKGQQPPLLDILIASICNRRNAELWHFGDQHFTAIAKALPVHVSDIKGR